MKVGVFRHRCKVVTGVTKNATPFAATREEEAASTLARKRKLEIAKDVVNILQCNVTSWSGHAKHYILTSEFDAALTSETHLECEKLVNAAK